MKRNEKEVGKYRGMYGDVMSSKNVSQKTKDKLEFYLCSAMTCGNDYEKALNILNSTVYSNILYDIWEEKVKGGSK